MSTRTVIASAIIGAIVGLAPIAAIAENPVFGTAKHKTLTTSAMKKVVGQGYYADLWGARGRVSLDNADYWAYWGIYYDDFGTEDQYFWNAYRSAKRAANQLYKAWFYAGT